MTTTTIKRRKKTSHGFHLAMTIFTFGFWAVLVWPWVAMWNALGPREEDHVESFYFHSAQYWGQPPQLFSPEQQERVREKGYNPRTYAYDNPKWGVPQHPSYAYENPYAPDEARRWGTAGPTGRSNPYAAPPVNQSWNLPGVDLREGEK